MNDQALPCARCGSDLPASGPYDTEATCSCGHATYLPYAREAAHLRAGLPQWQARLEFLEEALRSGERPALTSPAAPRPPRTTHQVLTSAGALLLLAGLCAFTAIMWRYLGRAGQAGVLLTITAALAAASVRVRDRLASTANSLAVVAAGSWLFTGIWFGHAIGKDHWWRFEHVYPTLLAGISAAGLLAAGRRFATPAWTRLGSLAVPVAASLAAACGAAIGVRHGGFDAGAVLPLAALPLSVALLRSAQGRPAVKIPAQHMWAAHATLACAIAAFALASPWGHPTAAAGWALHLAALVPVAFLSPRTITVTPALTATAAVLPAAAAGWPVALTASWALAAPALLALTRAKMSPTRLPEESKGQARPWALAAAAASPLWILMSLTARTPAQTEPYAIALLLAPGLAWMAADARRRTSALLPLAAAFTGAAALLIAHRLHAQSLEQYTLTLALVLAAAGALHKRAVPAAPSSTWMGPALGVALLPSAWIAMIAPDHSARFYLCLGASVAALITGAALRYSAPLAVGLAGAIILSLDAIPSLWGAVPHWVAFTASGALLLAVGARFEHLRGRAGQVRRWAVDSLR